MTNSSLTKITYNYNYSVIKKIMNSANFVKPNCKCLYFSVSDFVSLFYFSGIISKLFLLISSCTHTNDNVAGEGEHALTSELLPYMCIYTKSKISIAICLLFVRG